MCVDQGGNVRSAVLTGESEVTGESQVSQRSQVSRRLHTEMVLYRQTLHSVSEFWFYRVERLQGNRCSSHSRTGSHHAAGLTAPCRPAQELQGHSVPLDADLHRSLRTLHFHLLSEATLVLLQPAEAFLIALQRTNHSAANDRTSCCHQSQTTTRGD